MNDTPRITGMKHFLLVGWTLCRRECVRFVRQRSRVIGVIASPVVFWFLIGSGLGSSFRHPSAAGSSAAGGMSYLEYFYPGTMMLVVLFTSIFSTISLIEDRREGFLQSVLVAPVPRSAIALGSIMGGTVLSLIQGAILLVLAPVAGIPMSALTVMNVIGILGVLSFALTGLGFLIAWRMESTQGFHAIMNLFLIPLWMLSGALFPASGGWMGVVMLLNPLSYGLTALRQTLYNGTYAGTSGQVPFLAAAGITGCFALLTFGLSAAAVRRSDGFMIR